MGPSTDTGSISPASSVDVNDSTGNNPQAVAPSTNDNTQQTAAPSPSSPAPASGPVGQGSAPQPGQPGTQPGHSGPQGPASPKGPNQPNQKSAPANPAPQGPPPAVQRAGWLYKAAEVLTGGAKFKTSVDVNTGQTVRTRVPVSRADLGMALAMEAISGALAGLSQKGPGAEGRAAEAGFQQVSEEQQKVNDQQQQQANADFARHYQVLDTNMKLWQNAQTVGRQDFETNKDYVAQFKPTYDLLMKEHPEIFTGNVVNESDLSKFHVTKDTAIPINVVKRTDPKTGEQITDKMGKPLWDIQYAILDPHFKADNPLTPKDIQTLQEMQRSGFVNGDGKPSNLPQSIPMKVAMYMNLKGQIASYQLAKQDIQSYYDTLNKSVENGNVPMSAPAMHDQATQAIVDDAANRYNVPVALARAVAMQESRGNQGAVSSKGAIGVMQLMPDTAKLLGVDPNNTSQNIDGGVRYLRDLLYGGDGFKGYNGDVKLALAAYNAGPGRVTNAIPKIKETQDYVKAITDAVGMNNPEAPQSGDKNAYDIPDLAQAVRQDPTLVDALLKFQPLLNLYQGNYQQAIGHLGSTDPQAAGKVLQLYGGSSLVNHFDVAKKNLEEAQKKAADNAELLKRQTSDRAAKEAENEASYLADAKAIAGDPNDPGSGDMMQLKDLISQRTADRPKVFDMIKKINPNWNEANALLKLQTWEGFSDPKGKEYQQIKSANTLFDHIGAALDASENFHTTEYGEHINDPINKFKKNFEGDQNLARMIAAIEPVKSEFMTFLNANHALTEHDKKVGDDLLNWNMPVSVLESNLKQFAETSAYRLRETNNGFKRVFRTNAPGLVSDTALEALRKVPTAAQILAGMDTGGTFLGTSDGRGVLGQTVGKALGIAEAPQIPNGVRPAQPNEKPVWINNKFTGYTADGGKTYSYQYTGQ